MHNRIAINASAGTINAMSDATPRNLILSAYDHRRSRARFEAVARQMGVDPEIADAARRRLVAGEVVATVISGRQASGKDTLGPAFMEALRAEPYIRIGIADGIKTETGDLLNLLPRHTDRAAGAREAARMLGCAEQHAAVLVDNLWDATRDPDHGLTGWSRTPEIRRSLQYLGDEARTDDPTRYVRLAVPRILETLAEGTNVYMGDGRFPREAEPCREIGLFIVRLHVDPQVQAARLLTRDGIPPDPVALGHPGEGALDTWDGVDLRVDNSHASRSEVVAAIAGAYAMHQARARRDLA
jgi:hypothetical protein